MSETFPKESIGRRPLTLGEWLELTLVVAGAIAVRLIHVTNGLDYDETQHFSVANAPSWLDFLREMVPKAHPPLAYLPISPFLLLSTGAVAVKTAALICGICAVPASYFVLRRLRAGRFVPLMGAVAVGGLPAFVTQSIEARGYSLALLLVWLSFGVALRIRDEHFRRPVSHVALALVFLLTLMTVYSAVFHVVALSAVLYGPFAIRAIRRREWELLTSALFPQTLAAVVVATLFRWHFAGQVPVYEHSSVFAYSGSVTDLRGVTAFGIRGLDGFFRGMLPSPFCYAVPALICTALAAKSRTDGREPRLFAWYAALAIGLTFSAALRGSFPFGGTPRHNIAIHPGVVVAAVLGGHAVVSSVANRAVHLALVAVFAVAIVAGLATVPAAGEALGPVLDIRTDADEGRAGIIVNWRARMLLNWYAFRDVRPHLSGAVSRNELDYDYGQFRVLQVAHPTREHMIACVQTHGACWFVTSHARESDASHQAERVAAILQGRDDLGISKSRVQNLPLPTSLILVEKR